MVYVLLALFVCALCTGAHADRKTADLGGQPRVVNFSKFVPGQLSYQGYLVNAADSSAITATVEMTFRLFDTETKGAELWSETHPAVPVAGGLFDVQLGSVTPFGPGLFDGTPMWLQTEVGTEVLSPRKPLVSVAYSHRANSAERLMDYTLPDLDDRWVNEGQADGVTGVMILDGEIVDADIAPGAAIDPAKIAGTAWTAGNDGAGSGLDADLLDGQHAAAFIGMADLDHLDAADGDPAEAVYVDDAGKVGIGTTSPTTELDVNGTVNATAYLGDGSGLTGIAGAPDGDWTVAGFDMYSGLSGNVGIGTATPVEKLHVVGSSGNYAIIGGPTYGVYGRHTANNKYGYLGGSYGVYGADFGTNNKGYLGGDNYGVYGSSAAGHAGYFEGTGYFSGDVGIGVTSPAQELHTEGVFPQIHMHDSGMGAEFFTAGVGGAGFSIDDHLGNEPFLVRYGTPNATLIADSNGGVTIGSFAAAQAGLEIYADVNDYELWLTETETTVNDHAQIYFDSDQGDWNLGVNSGTGIFYLYESAAFYDAMWVYWDADSSEYEVTFWDDVYVGDDFMVGGAKSFVQEDPVDPSKAIVYACLEGPEAGTYQRGTAQLTAGRATIELPDHFAKVTADQGLTVQLTPVGEWLDLYVVEKSPDRIVVAEASGREGSFDYLIQGVRKGYENYQVVRGREEIPGLDRQKGKRTIQGGSPGTESRASAVRETAGQRGNTSSVRNGRGAKE
jgi:hypothetical protein